MQVTLSGVSLELLKGDITDQSDLSAVVNAANAQLMPGGGVAGAIHKHAGLELQEACRPFAPIRPGEVVLTEGFNLPNDYVVHCLGPVYGKDMPSDELLAKCYKNSLEVCENHEISSVGFPAISTGAFGYPKEEAAKIALQTVIDSIPKLENITVIRVILFDEESYSIYQKILQGKM